MKIIKLTDTNNQNVTQSMMNVLLSGGLVIAPSDTVYGLLVDATNEQAVDKLRLFKNRPPGKPISVFLSDINMLEKQASININQKKMLETLLPGPFTIILESKHKVSKELESEKGTLGIRIPDYSFIQNIVAKYNVPVTATSANLSGKSPYYSIDSLIKDLPRSKLNLIDLIIDSGKLPRNKPSTIIDLTQSDIKVLRQGDIVLKNSKTYISKSPIQTLRLGEYLINKYLSPTEKKPLILIIEGNLGVGKTVLVKGIAGYLGINNIISPTYVIYYEYKINKYNLNNLYHYDLYQVEEQDEFKHLGIELYLKAKNILCFEWGEKTGSIINMLKNKGKIIHLSMKYIDESKREITVTNIN